MSTVCMEQMWVNEFEEYYNHKPFIFYGVEVVLVSVDQNSYSFSSRFVFKYNGRFVTYSMLFEDYVDDIPDLYVDLKEALERYLLKRLKYTNTLPI